MAGMYLICPTPAGGLPLGTVITTREDEATIDAALDLYSSILPEKACFGRGSNGPKIIMTDDGTAERNAISKQWPNVVLLLCVFHLLQAFWRWLWDSKNKIDKANRPTIFNSFKAVLYAANDADFKLKEKDLLKHPVVTKYENLLSRIKKDILPRKEEWSLATRFTNNFVQY